MKPGVWAVVQILSNFHLLGTPVEEALLSAWLYLKKKQIICIFRNLLFWNQENVIKMSQHWVYVESSQSVV